MQFVKNTDDAEEIVNDSFVAVWEKRNEFALTHALKPYLYKTVHNRSLNFLKKKKLLFYETESDSLTQLHTSQLTPFEILSMKELERKVHKLMTQLPPRCKQIFLLSRVEGFSHKEIATIMDISTKTIENQITIALKYIKKGLEENNNKPNNSSLLSLYILTFFINP
jgi:RNA polymerase sigma-70 factor (ECF subfamily)